jgi:lipopolysaccharide/colanic/teichoic acid biosynthesis glycosyltransferase
MIKCLFDVVVAVCALLVVWPLILIGALAVKLTSPGPASYRAKRAGLEGKPFDLPGPQVAEQRGSLVRTLQ